MDMVDTPIDIKPLIWTEWSSRKSEEVHGYIVRPHSTSRGKVNHWLTELGDTTNTYRYAVYYKYTLLVGKTIRPKCCGGLDKCPIKHYALPAKPCRDTLRLQAQEEAQWVWLEFLRSIADNTQ